MGNHDFFDLFRTFLIGHSAKWPVQDGGLGHVSPCFLTLSYTILYAMGVATVSLNDCFEAFHDFAFIFFCFRSL